MSDTTNNRNNASVWMDMYSKLETSWFQSQLKLKDANNELAELREQLKALDAQKPVAWMFDDDNGDYYGLSFVKEEGKIALYRQAKPAVPEGK